MARYGIGRLMDSQEIPSMQRKLENLYDNYNYNSNFTNYLKCSEIIDQNTDVHRKLVGSLCDISSESPIYSTSRSWHRYPYYSYYYPYYGYYPYTSASAAAAIAASAALNTELTLNKTIARKNAEISDLSYKYGRELDELESDLNCAKINNRCLKSELNETKGELIQERARSASRNLACQADIAALKSKLSRTELKLSTLEPRAELAKQLEREISDLKNEIRRVKCDNAILADHNEFQAEVIRSRATSPVCYWSRPCSPVRSRPISPCRSRPRSCSPYRLPSDSSLSPNHCIQVARQENLAARFDDLYTCERLNAMDTLRNFCDNYENNQRIIFAALQEAFSVAKRNFADWKIRVRSTVALTHLGPETLEEAVQNYINRNIDLYDLPCMTSEVICGLNKNPKICLPVGVSYSIINTFIREACRLAWEMSTLAYPLDTALAIDAEVMDETKYRRTYDSEYSAPLVNHHIWPCLMQGTRVISKGEACTKRGASLNRSRSRNCSPLRSCLRNRSTSPMRRARSCYSMH